MTARLPLVDHRVWRGPVAVPPSTGSTTTVPLLGTHRPEFILGVVIWGASFLGFWIWWFLPEHNIGTAGFLYVTVPFAWLTLMPFYFLWMLSGARVPAPDVMPPPGSRVAMITTKTPSEPFGVVAETLLAMLAQDYPHDTWLADEDPSPQTVTWCEAHGVKLSTRKGHPDYQRDDWPRRKRCKEGNLAFFYDTYGYEQYDFVAQMDADHVPTSGYLVEMLRPFADPAIGYVSAPSLCDKNAATSWPARARLYSEATMHGPLQAGYSGGWAPLCIGSHYAVRTTALKSIGGLGPELAEDHSTTLLMNAHGWRGMHALNAIAHGDGPRTMADLVTQEFQWSRSLVTILLRYMPALLGHLPPRLRFEFLFCQVWYPEHSLIWMTLFAMPIVALASHNSLVNVAYLDFVLHYSPMASTLTAMAFRWRAWGWLRPVDARVLSWEGTFFVLAKWPWSLLGSLMAVVDWLRGSFVDFRITPKGDGTVGDVPLVVFGPYAFIALASALAPLLLTDVGPARGFYIFTVINSLLYSALLVTIVLGHRFDSRGHRAPVGFQAYAKAAGVAAIVLIAGVALEERGVEGLTGLAFGTGNLRFTRTIYSAAGAGNERQAHTILIWPTWEEGPPGP